MLRAARVPEADIAEWLGRSRRRQPNGVDRSALGDVALLAQVQHSAADRTNRSEPPASGYAYVGTRSGLERPATVNDPEPVHGNALDSLRVAKRPVLTEVRVLRDAEVHSLPVLLDERLDARATGEGSGVSLQRAGCERNERERALAGGESHLALERDPLLRDRRSAG